MAIDSDLPGDINQAKRQSDSTPLGMSLTPQQMQAQQQAAGRRQAAQTLNQAREGIGNVAQGIGDMYAGTMKAATVVPRTIYGVASGEIPVNVQHLPDYGVGQRRAQQWVENNPQEAAAARGQMQGIADRAVGSALEQVRAAPHAPGGLSLAKPGKPASAPAQTPAAQSGAEPAAAAPASQPPQQPQTQGNGFRQTGINGVVGRRNGQGIMEFSNAAGDISGTSAEHLTEGNMGDGIGGLSYGQAGDAAQAIERFERANAERARMVQLSRGGIGDTGNFTVVADSTRGRQADRDLEARRRRRDGTDVAEERNRIAESEIRQRGIEAGLDREAQNQNAAADRALTERELAEAEQTGQLTRQRTQQEIAQGELTLAEAQRQADLQRRILDPNTPETERSALLSRYQEMNTPLKDRTVLAEYEEYNAEGLPVASGQRLLDRRTGQPLDGGAQRPAQQRWSEGKIYRDGNGNRARFTGYDNSGNPQWETL